MGSSGLFDMLEGIAVVIFDCDGVMFDSAKANTGYYNCILRHFSLPEMSSEQLEFVHMHTGDEAIEYLFGAAEMVQAAQAYRRKVGYLPFIKYMAIAPYLKPFLKRLKLSCHTAVATNRTDTMGRVLSEHQLEGWFDLVVTALDVALPKPHPDQLNAILAHFGIKPHQAVFLGDSKLDELAAEAAGVPFIAYSNDSLSAGLHISDFRTLEQILFPEG